MKKLLPVVFLLLLLAGGFFLLQKKSIVSPITRTQSAAVSPTEAPGTETVTSTLFVPYWSLDEEGFGDTYDRLVYFGVTPGESGLNTSDAGYKALPTFVRNTQGTPTSLTLRMLDSKQNFRILDNSSLQNALITETIQTAKDNGFTGIVLDLEVSALPFDSLIQQISSFNKRFYTEAKKQNLRYSVALYGDTFFRIRPFDVKSIATNSDEVMIMAYDFHKSRGNPGPNFPLSGKEKYGYDYSSLIKQFTEAVPKQKLTVIFGFFGYDWAVNKEKNMLMHGVPLSLNQIQDRFLTECQFSDCRQKRDALSAESEVSYVTDDGEQHLVWYEDAASAEKKKAYLRQQGISSFADWAYSYF